jgi:hypothetical protein
LNRPRRFNFLVAGISHDGRADTIRENMVEDQHVFLVRDPANPFDANAIRIFTKRRGSKMEHTGEAIVNLQFLEIGFVPRDDAADMAPLLDAHYKFVALCTQILREARRGPIPIIAVSLYHPDAATAPPDALPAMQATFTNARQYEPEPGAPPSTVGLRPTLAFALAGIIMIAMILSVLAAIG